MSDAADDPVPRPEARCVVCDVVLEVEGCCSATCVQTAERELKRIAVVLQRPNGGPTGAERRELAERNGRLLSALMRWRSVTTSDGHADPDSRATSSP